MEKLIAISIALEIVCLIWLIGIEIELKNHRKEMED